MLFMDVHNIAGGVTVDAVAGAHGRGPRAPDRDKVDYQRYWVDEEAGKIFCLVEAPDAETANTVHREAHRPGRRRDLPGQRVLATGTPRRARK